MVSLDAERAAPTASMDCAPSESMKSAARILRCKSDADKGMFHDIWQTPIVFTRVLSSFLKEENGSHRIAMEALEKPFAASHGLAGRTPLEVLAAGANGATNNRVVIVGCGTSYHAAVLAEYLIEHMARVPVEVQYAGEFNHREAILRAGDTFIVVSNSGESDESVESLRLVKNGPMGKDVMTMAFVNDTDSTLAREADVCISAMAGEEIGVTSTKAFSGTCLGFVLLAAAIGQKAGTMTEQEVRELVSDARNLPQNAQAVLEREARPLTQDGKDRRLLVGDCTLWDMACQNALAANFIFLGRGFNFPMALEGAMKCKELAYIHAEGYPAAEMKHGPIALIDQFMPVVCIAPKADPTYDKFKANIEEVNARCGATIAITEETNRELEDLCEYVVHVPPTHEYLMPLLNLIPLQLLGYMMGVLRGNEVNQPRHLVKSISSFAPAPRAAAAS